LPEFVYGMVSLVNVPCVDQYLRAMERSEARRVPWMEVPVPDLRQIVLLSGCGHWTQQERPDAVNTALNDSVQRESEI
jgi:pimeloyl-ACP methyl ester carboxylesterase